MSSRGNRRGAVIIHTTTRLLAVTLAAVALSVLSVTPAFAYQEPNGLPGAVDGCIGCHSSNDYQDYIDDCTACHGDVNVNMSPGFEMGNPQGPHGNYLTTTRRCSLCHKVHKSTAAGVMLLREATVTGTCFTCHDGTGGWGVYGAIEARYPGADPSGHAVDLTNVVPGGDASTGGSATMSFAGVAGGLGCTDCHAPHAANIVNPFPADRLRLRQSHTGYQSARLLRNDPAGTGATISEYGSDWCLSCHQGRGNAQAQVHNHPVDSAASSPVPPGGVFTYGRVAILASNEPTSVTFWRGLGGVTPYNESSHGELWGDPDAFGNLFRSGNRGFLMPYPRTTGAGGQVGHAPICQQCHEDSRHVGALVGNGSIGDATTAVVHNGDGVKWDVGTGQWVLNEADNPLFQNFPHETQNDYMLVENDDDLCLNCHPQGY